MLDRMLAFLQGHDMPGQRPPEPDLKASVAALLVEAAQMDATFGAEERACIEDLLAEKFELAPEDVASTLKVAEETVASSTQNFPFTHRINQMLDASQKSQVIEMLWQIAYADGVLDPDEDAMIRQIAGLIYVTDRERAVARQRALARLGRDDEA